MANLGVVAQRILVQSQPIAEELSSLPGKLKLKDGILLKFVFFEKATKFDEISILLLTNKFVFFVSRYSFEHQSGSQSWNFIH